MDMLTQPKRRVLIVEDREEWQKILSGALTRGESAPDIQMVRSYGEALRALSGGQFTWP
jgi:ActR/RegA family two-component response regulator